MERKSGRPAGISKDSRERLIETTIALIRRDGAENITVRSVCEAAGLSIGTFYYYFKNKDDLMMYFLKEKSFKKFTLKTDLLHIGDRISELYMHLIDRYMVFGDEFMKRFYSSSNRSLSAYMSDQNGHFPDGTVMARCENEMWDAVLNGIIRPDVDLHLASMDICTIVKGCVFEWCLKDGEMDIKASVYRIINNYMLALLV